MDIQAEKLLLIEELLRITDMRIIEQIRDLLRKENPVVGYEPDGNPIAHRDFIKAIEQSEKEYAQGKYETISELEKDSENW